MTETQQTQVTPAPRGRRSRRPSANLNLSSISPLTPSAFALTDSNSVDDEGHFVSRSSYLQANSAPSTPGILSRASSHHRNHRSYAALTSLTPFSKPGGAATDLNNNNRSSSTASLSKSKSSSYLVHQGHSRSRSSQHNRRKSVEITSRDSSEWLSRTGAAVSNETRASKGQSWLMSRASSTSLVDDDNDDDDAAEEQQDIEKLKRKAKRRTIPGGDAESYFRTTHTGGDGIEPAFIDDIFGKEGFSDEESGDDDDDDDDEIHWSAHKGSVFGAWVDRIIGFSLFDVDEEDEEEAAAAAAAEEEKKRKGGLKRGKRIEREVAIERKVEPKEREDEGWQDAAWIFAIATKVLL